MYGDGEGEKKKNKKKTHTKFSEDDFICRGIYQC